ncbi:MAG TPA: hypothetical protein VHP11_07075 [Tepidisphaeraceae bacterium]|nr:hypothetical protein [Tepidisphaeraceae bacterium]
MDIWIKTLLLQSGICVVSIILGVAVLRLSLASAILAAVLVTPVPLFKVSAGTAGFIYAADLLAIVLLLRRLFGGAVEEARATLLIRLSFLMLVLLPALSTLLGYAVNPQERGLNFVFLNLARGFAYFVVFSAFVGRANREVHPDSILVVQCVAFWLVACCGLVHYLAGVDLDLWNRQLGVEQGILSGGFGGGFMGLYRGAVGAWGMAIVGITPVVFAQRRFGGIVTPAIVVTVMGSIMAVGSRQGAVIGGLSLIIGYVMAVRSRPAGMRVGAFLRGMGSIGLLGILVVAGWGAFSPYSFQRFVVRRFDFLLDPALAVEMAKARTSATPFAVENVTGNAQTFLVGVGYGLEGGSSGLGSGLRMVMIDSEILMTWQEGGILLLMVYAAFLVMLRFRWQHRNWPADAHERTVVGAAVVALYGGIALLYGHFFIMNVHASEAPIAYWNWALFGIAVGLTSKHTQQPQVEVPQPISHVF